IARFVLDENAIARRQDGREAFAQRNRLFERNRQYLRVAPEGTGSRRREAPQLIVDAQRHAALRAHRLQHARIVRGLASEAAQACEARIELHQKSCGLPPQVHVSVRLLITSSFIVWLTSGSLVTCSQMFCTVSRALNSSFVVVKLQFVRS